MAVRGRAHETFKIYLTLEITTMEQSLLQFEYVYVDMYNWQI